MVAKKTGKAIQKGKKLKAGTLTRPAAAKLLRGAPHPGGLALTRPGSGIMTRPTPGLMTRKVFDA